MNTSPNSVAWAHGISIVRACKWKPGCTRSGVISLPVKFFPGVGALGLLRCGPCGKTTAVDERSSMATRFALCNLRKRIVPQPTQRNPLRASSDVVMMRVTSVAEAQLQSEVPHRPASGYDSVHRAPVKLRFQASSAPEMPGINLLAANRLIAMAASRSSAITA